MQNGSYTYIHDMNYDQASRVTQMKYHADCDLVHRASYSAFGEVRSARSTSECFSYDYIDTGQRLSPFRR